MRELNRARLFSASNAGPDGAIWQSTVSGSSSSATPPTAEVPEHLAGLAEPVRGEERVHLLHHGPAHLDQEVPPLEPALPVAALVARLDEVRGAEQRDPLVHDDELAVVAEVGPLVPAPQRLHRQHEAPGMPTRSSSAQAGRKPGYFFDPRWSTSTRTATPRPSPSPSAAKTGRVASSRANV